MRAQRLRHAIVLACLVLPGMVFASECFAPINAEGMRSARHASVVRVVGTGVPNDPKQLVGSFGIAQVQVVDRLRGSAAPKRLKYPRGPWCGLRIDAGAHYLVFLDAPGDMVDVSMANLVMIDIRDAYTPTGIGRHWRSVLDGKRSLGPDHDWMQMDAMSAQRPPPPPR